MPDDVAATTDDVVMATSNDIACILHWLEREYAEDGTGFWCNQNLIARPTKTGCLQVIHRDGEAVAFHLGSYSADIVSVRKDFRGRGLGKALVQASISRAYRDDVNMLSVHCFPEASLGFWQRMGFVQYDDPDFPDRVQARLIIQRDLDLPASSSLAKVVIGFYPESATYPNARDVGPIAEHHVAGSHDDDGSIMLSQRVIGLRDDEPEGDIVIKVEVDGVQRCFCKAKYERAEFVGVNPDYLGRTFFIDRIEPEWADD